MRRILPCCLTVILLAAPAYPAHDPLKRAMELYRMHHYEDAATVLRSSMVSVKAGRQSIAHLSLGLVYLKNAELYRVLYRTSVSVQLDYLKKLAAFQGKTRSRLVDLYTGEALLEDGRPGEAARAFERFILDKSVGEKYREIARVELGLSYHLAGNGQKTKGLWERVDRTDLEVLSELAAAHSKAGLVGENPQTMCDRALAMAKQSGNGVPIRVIKNALGVYARAGLIEKGLDLLRLADLKAFSSEEVLGKNKVLRFYDLSLLDNLAKLYGKASIEYLTKATADDRSRNAANYYLGEAYAILGSIDQSAEVTSSFISSDGAPTQFKVKAKARQAALLYLQGRKTEAMSRWNELLQQRPNSPDLLADILSACGRLGVECSEIVSKAVALAEAREGKRLSGVNVALGRYYLGKKDYGKTISYMEAGRNKGNKNRIEYNDPLMLINLAEAYYQTMRFSEALEIYFEMSRQFPAVRQIQVAMQGVYSMEQKSAGDARIL
ncbi:MAG: tetratricopeptide repeat protein [Thermodesulfobacteriota bacterium]